MDYSRLSRETLIHEIKQLNEKVERLKIMSQFDSGAIDEVFKLLDSVPDIVTYMDKSMIIKWGNQAAKVHDNQLLGKKCHQFLFGNSTFCDDCPCLKSMSDNKSHSKIYHLDEKSSIESIILPVFDEIGIVTGYLAIVRNIESNQSEIEMLKDQLTTLNQSLAKSEKQHGKKAKWLTNLSKIMSTNLKTTKAAVRILDNAELSDIEKQYLQVADTSLNELNYMLNDILDYSRIEENSIRLSRKEFRVNSLIDRLIERYKYLASDKKLILEHFIDQGIPSIIIGDEDKLFMVLSRIVENAIKFTESGSVKINVNEVNQNNDYVDVKFVISDTGIGIKSEELNQVFDRYYVTDYAKDKYDSIGLGLNIVRDILSVMDSKVDILSSLGRGTTVSFIIRFKKVRMIANDFINQIDFNEIKILIVDKNISVDIVNYLISKGYNVQFEDNGERAISIFKRWHPDIIVTGIMIDDYDGFTIFDEVEKTSVSRIPVIATSEKIIDTEREFLISYGFAEYMPKPIEKEQLCRTIEDLVKSFRK